MAINQRHLRTSQLLSQCSRFNEDTLWHLDFWKIIIQSSTFKVV